MTAEWIETDDVRGTLLYLQGGGYIEGSAASHRAIPAGLAMRGFRVFSPDYRLAPEHPFPAAIDDAKRAFIAIASASSRPIAVAGDSAGGGLALAVIMLLHAEASQMPKAAALFSPWTDLTITGESVTRNQNRCALASQDYLRHVAALYLESTHPMDPRASPLYGDLRSLPPLLVHVGADEGLLDDSTRFVSRARAMGTQAELKVWQVVPHCWQILPWLPEARLSLNEAAEFLHAH